MIKKITITALDHQSAYLQDLKPTTSLKWVLGAGLLITIMGIAGVQQAHAASTLDVLNFITPDGGVGVSKNLAYGDNEQQNLDIYYPKPLAQAIKKQQSVNQPYPMVIFVHGGSWESGNKDEYAFVGQSFAKAGYVTAVINYRKAPEFVYPAYVQDTAQAIAWAHHNADKFYADASRLAVVGQSAGAFNAVAAVSNANFLAPYGLQPSNIKTVVGIAGPYSYDFRTSETRSVFPKDGDPDNIMPDRLVKAGEDGKQPSYLLLTAEKDTLVGDQNTQKMAQSLQQAGVTVTTQEIPKANHYTSIGAMATSLRWLNPVRQQVLDYLAQELSD